MKTDTHFLSYIAEFFLEWGNSRTKVVEKIKTHFSRSITFSENLIVYQEMLKKCGRVRQATDGNIIRRRKDARIQTHTQNV